MNKQTSPRILLSFTIVCLLPVILLLSASLYYEHIKIDPWADIIIQEDHAPVWCEEDRSPYLVRNPTAAYTGFFYYWTGVWILFCAYHDMVNKVVALNPLSITNFPSMSLVFGSMNVIHGLGVVYNHACICHWGLRIDETFMMAVIAYPCVFNLFLFYPTVKRGDSGERFLHVEYNILYLSVVLFFVVRGIYDIPYVIEMLFVPLMITGCCSGYRYYLLHNHEIQLYINLLGLLTGILFVAVVMWLPEWYHGIRNTYGWCYLGTEPRSILQVHGIWHILTSAVLSLAYAYIRSIDEPSVSESISFWRFKSKTN